MNLIIPFESKVNFDSKVAEICSISLEHEETINESEVLGNFLITGTYKEYDLSVNTLDFKFTLPYSVELQENIDRNTLDISIDNFTYDVNNNQMDLKIDYVVCAEEKVESIDPIDLINDEDFIELRKEVQITDEIENKNQSEEPINEEIVDRNMESFKDVSNIVSPEEDYITFHVHFVKEGETFESIALMYKSDVLDIKLINNKESIAQGDKLLIPLDNE